VIAGFYDFSTPAGGQPVVVPARFSFVMVKKKTVFGGSLIIIPRCGRNRIMSKMPIAQNGLQHVERKCTLRKRTAPS
jgi:hypothetical protein